jgi:hypothetical protein
MIEYALFKGSNNIKKINSCAFELFQRILYTLIKNVNFVDIETFNRAFTLAFEHLLKQQCDEIKITQACSHLTTSVFRLFSNEATLIITQPKKSERLE